MELICTKCGKTYPIDVLRYRCELCDEPLEYELVVFGSIRQSNQLTQNILDRYADFFPYFQGMDYSEYSMREGFTPLLESKKLAAQNNIGRLYFKNESINPTWSFKDRGTLTGVLHAITLGYKKVSTVSSGNTAMSVAAYGARAGLKTFVFVSSLIPSAKLNPIAIYRPKLIKVEGRYDLVQKNSIRLGAKHGIYVLNSDAPFRLEGYKTLAFEICEQTQFDVPDYVLVPNSSGGHIRGIEKGFREFMACGLIQRIPKIVCVQAAGCSPVYNAFIAGQEEITRVEHPETIAHGIENAYPPSGNQVLRMLKRNGGFSITVTDEDMLKAQETLSETGVMVQPESAASLAAVEKMSREGTLKPDDRVLCVLTGSGLKDTDSLNRHNLTSLTCSLDEMESLLSEES